MSFPQKLESKEDMMPLTDPNWVVQKLNSLESRSIGGGKPWPGLGSKKAVLELNKA